VVAQHDGAGQPAVPDDQLGVPPPDRVDERDGVLASREEVAQRWEEMIACARDPRGYALWQVPVWTAINPA